MNIDSAEKIDKNSKQKKNVLDSSKQKKSGFSFVKYLKKHKWGVVLFFIAQIVPIMTNTAITILAARTIELVALSEFYTALKTYLIVAVITLGKNVFDIIYSVIFQKVQISILMEMYLDIGEQAFKISSKSYSEHNTGNFTERIVSDPQWIFNYVTQFVSDISYLISDLIIIIYITVLSPLIGGIFILFTLIIICIDKVRLKLMKIYRARRMKKNEEMISLLNEVIRSERDIKSLNLEEPLRKNMHKKYGEYKQAYLKSANTETVLFRVMWMISKIGGFIALGIGIVLMDRALLTLGTFMVIYSNYTSASEIAHTITDMTENVVAIRLSYERINELYENDEYALETFGSVHLDKVKGKIEFRRVGFTYKELERKKNPNKGKKKNKSPADQNTTENQSRTKSNLPASPVFKNLSFKIEPNTTVAFVGESGSGKSTILNLISKLYQADNGKVLIDGVDINDLDKETLRSSIALVNQFPYIFDMSIRANLLLAKPDSTEEELNQAVKQSALDEFVAILPHGLDTVVGESGIKLSGGQRQRLAIARALLKKASIILFDESTSSLDNLAQNVVKESIDNIKGTGTIVIVAHRLSTIKNVDKIFFLENSEIVDSGTFNELYKRNRAFKTMFKAENL